MFGAGKDENNPFAGLVHSENVHHRFVLTRLYVQRVIDDVEQFNCSFPVGRLNNKRSAWGVVQVPKGGLTVIRYFACHQLSPALLNGHEAFVASLEMCMVGSGSAAFGAVVKDCIISQLLCQIQHIAETGGYALIHMRRFRYRQMTGKYRKRID